MTDLQRALEKAIAAMCDEAAASQPKRDALLELLSPAAESPMTGWDVGASLAAQH
jgi:hypothetical protein